MPFFFSQTNAARLRQRQWIDSRTLNKPKKKISGSKLNTRKWKSKQKGDTREVRVIIMSTCCRVWWCDMAKLLFHRFKFSLLCDRHVCMIYGACGVWMNHNKPFIQKFRFLFFVAKLKWFSVEFMILTDIWCILIRRI